MRYGVDLFGQRTTIGKPYRSLRSARQVARSFAGIRRGYRARVFYGPDRKTRVYYWHDMYGVHKVEFPPYKRPRSS